MKVLVATAMYPTPEKPAFGSFIRTQVEALKQAGVDIELLVLDGHPRKLIYPRGVVQLRRRLAAGSVDLVHAHYSYVGMVARMQWLVPVVVSYCGSDILGMVRPDGNETHFSKLSVAAGRLLGQVVDAVIVKSKEMAARFKRNDVYVIPNEVDFEIFRPVDREQARAILGLEPTRKYLLFAANPQISVKRFPLARTVADHMTRQDPSIELLVVHKETQDRLALYMNACDALVFTSFQEGSPNIVKQAMACDLPVISTDVGDVREIIGDTPGCYICEPDVTEFAERLDEVLRLRQRTQGRQAVRHLERPAVAGRIIKVYEDILRKHAARHNRRSLGRT